MDIALVAEVYTPILNETHDYVDKIPSNISTHGIRCSCGSRKNKVFLSTSTFSSHLKTKCHIEWLHELNLNKVNHLRENEELQRTVASQRLIIANYEKEHVNNLRTINYLTQQVMKYREPTA